MRIGVARPPSYTVSTITFKVVVYAPAERADTHPLFLLYLYIYSVFLCMLALEGIAGQFNKGSCNSVRARDNPKPRRSALIGVLPNLPGGVGQGVMI